jgi:hypothetical protein
MAPKTKGEPFFYRGSPRGIGHKVAESWQFGEEFRMPNVKVQSSWFDKLTMILS